MNMVLSWGYQKTRLHYNEFQLPFVKFLSRDLTFWTSQKTNLFRRRFVN